MAKLSAKTIRAYNQLNPEQRQKVNHIIRRHWAALVAAGLQWEYNPEQACHEAITVVLTTEAKGYDSTLPFDKYERPVKFDVYTSPATYKDEE